jgi:hypothetical protein
MAQYDNLPAFKELLDHIEYCAQLDAQAVEAACIADMTTYADAHAKLQTFQPQAHAAVTAVIIARAVQIRDTKPKEEHF